MTVLTTSAPAPHDVVAEVLATADRVADELRETAADYLVRVEVPGIRKVRQVAPDRLQGHVESLCQILDHHPALGPGQFQNLRLAKVQGHAGSFSFDIRASAFCHADPALSATFSPAPACGILRLQKVSQRLRIRTAINVRFFTNRVKTKNTR